MVYDAGEKKLQMNRADEKTNKMLRYRNHAG